MGLWNQTDSGLSLACWLWDAAAGTLHAYRPSLLNGDISMRWSRAPMSSPSQHLVCSNHSKKGL